MKNNSGIACNPQIKTLTKYLEPKHVVLSWKKGLRPKEDGKDTQGICKYLLRSLTKNEGKKKIMKILIKIQVLYVLLIT